MLGIINMPSAKQHGKQSQRQYHKPRYMRFLVAVHCH
ncbi:Uncharacterised protein [Vibrio cholerae]|nr:Uncharacterised protein [Vibrio cholerae]CSD36612.1 Uncharacterised protein [Vibrio cholerae]CSI53985.1 Uncharacterised protein [Vibrio cholerae]